MCCGISQKESITDSLSDIGIIQKERILSDIRKQEGEADR